MLIGNWQCRDLNPLPGQPPQTVATRYADDGSFRSVSELPVHGPIGSIEIEQRGRWALDGDRLITSDVTTAARALDGTPRPTPTPRPAPSSSMPWVRAAR